MTVLTTTQDHLLPKGHVGDPAQEACRGLNLMVPAILGPHQVLALVDTAAQATLVNQEICEGWLRRPLTDDDQGRAKLRGLGGQIVWGWKVLNFPFRIGDTTYQWDVIATPIVEPMIIGLDFLTYHRGRVDLTNHSITLRDERVDAQLKRSSTGETMQVSRVVVAKRLVVGPNTIAHVKVGFAGPVGNEKDFCLEPTDSHRGALVARAVVSGEADILRILNPTRQYVTFKKGYHIANAVEVRDMEEPSLDSGDVPCDDSVNTCKCASMHAYPAVSGQTLDGHSEASACGATGPPILPGVSATVLLLQTARGPCASGCAVESLADGGATDANATPELASEHGTPSWQPSCTSPRQTPSTMPLADTAETLPEDSGTGVLPDKLHDLYEQSQKHLTSTQAAQLKQLLCEFEDVFADHDLDLGCLSSVKHTIDTGDARPFKEKIRRCPLGFENEEERHLKKMLDAGVIQPSNSDWASAPVLVRKKDGSVRYCVDFRRLNSLTVKDAFPLPLIEDCLDSLAGTQYFSTLDMASGYYQIEMDEAARRKSAFVTRYGLFEHTRMGFGLCNAPATFQRAMNLVLKGLTWKEVLAYIDDIMVLGNDFDDHLNNLRKTLLRVQHHHLKLKPRKCLLFQIEVDFLGKTVSREGVSIQPSKIDTVTTWPEPTDKKKLQAFLGFANYHREHVRGYGGMSACLYEVAGSKTPFSWEQPQHQAFETIKHALSSAPCLAYPQGTGTFILDTDASDRAIGAELSQEQDGMEKVIGYSSHSLQPVQRRYCTTRKELLAVVKFCRHYRHYLLGRPFLLRTDHGSLVWLMRFKRPEGQLARWLEELQQYDMRILHRPGRQHCNADGLSRRPDPEDPCECYEAGKDLGSLPCGGCPYCTRASGQWDRFHDDVDDVVPLAIRAVRDAATLDGTKAPSISQAREEHPGEDPSDQPETAEFDPEADGDEIRMADQDAEDPLVPPVSNWAAGHAPAGVRQHQLEDPDLRPILTWLETEVDPEQHELFLSSPTTKALWLCKVRLFLRDGVLHYRWDNDPLRDEVLVVPKGLREEILHDCHDAKVAGHLGQSKTYLRVRQKFMWRNMARDCREYVGSCAVCNVNKKAQTHGRAGLGRYHAGFPLERVHLDILGPFVTSRQGNKYVLSMVDQFSKWVELAAVPDQTAEVIAQHFLTRVITTFGCPLEVHTDQGRNFTSNLFKALCDLLQIAKTCTTPYRPSSNGQVESYNRVILQFVRCFSEGKPDRWDECLPMLMMALHSMVHRQTGYSANHLMLGREVLQPIDLVLGTLDRQRMVATPSDWLAQLANTLEMVHVFVRKNLQTTQARQKRDYDLRVHERKFQVGDLVYKLDSSTKVGAKALKPLWKGPYVVVRANSPLYKLQDRKRSGVWHHDKIKLCQDRHVPLWLRRLRGQVLDRSLEEEDAAEPVDQDPLDLDALENAWWVAPPQEAAIPEGEEEADAEATQPENEDETASETEEAGEGEDEAEVEALDSSDSESTPATHDMQPEVQGPSGPVDAKQTHTRAGRTSRRPAHFDLYDTS